MAESPEHKKLKKLIRKFLEKCDFDVVDSEIHFDFDGDGEADFSIDVAAIHDKYLIGIEFKSSKLSSPKNKIKAAKKNLDDVIKFRKKKIIMKSDLKKITNKKLEKIKEFRYCYAFGKNFDNKTLKKLLEKNGMALWDYNALKYYDKVSKVLGIFTRNEILRDFNILIGEKGTHLEDAIIVEQGNYPPMFLLGMHPGLLLQMGYVSRRAKKERNAYQRIINKQRLENLSKYLNTKNSLLANPVIIAFDKDTRSNVHFDEKKKTLVFPTTFCSAWIIDGQHRIFAFKDTKYKKWSENINEQLKLPVVAFKDLPDPQQTRTFVDINYHQKRIDPILFCDLAASLEDLQYELTWTSLISLKLNECGPWKDMIKTSETQSSKPLNLNALARHVLLTDLLGYDEKTGKYSGPLYNYAPFYPGQKFRITKNQTAFDKQVGLLNNFFNAVKSNTKTRWNNPKKYGLTKATCVNGLLLVLFSFFKKYPKMKLNLEDSLKPISKMVFTNKRLLKYGRGIPAYRPIANDIIQRINDEKGLGLALV